MGRILATIRRFGADERGIALLLVTIMLPVLLGFALLTLDMSRASNLQNDLQKAADAFALAAAAELDGSPGAWARAERAMETLIDNTSRFSTAGQHTLVTTQQGGTARCNSSGDISWCFLKTIPASDGTPITSANYANADPAIGQGESRFIEVTVTPTSFVTLFPASFLSGNVASNGMSIGTKATAGFTSSVCDYTPVFICNPYEDSPGGVTLEMAANQRQHRRKQLLMRGDDFYGPGNFSFLKAPDGNGAAAVENMLASTKPNACYSRDGVDTEPGQMTGPVKDGLNARFGLTPAYALSDGPSPNSRAGIKNVECQNGKIKKFDFETDPSLGTGLPRDGCFPNCTPLDSSHPTDAGMLGDGDWDFTNYWARNHTVSGTPRAVPTEIAGTGTNLPTRYEVYRSEIAHNFQGDSGPAPNLDTGTPACGVPAFTAVDRRILYGAIVNCKALAAAGISMNGRQTDVPVIAFGSFFLTEPIKDGKDIYAELVDITGKGGTGTLDNFLRDEAQLYR